MRYKNILLLLIFANSGIVLAEPHDDQLGVLISELPYMSDFCFEPELFCVPAPDADVYSGMKGRLSSLQPDKRVMGKNIFKLHMENGSTLYFSTEHDSPFTGFGMIPLAEHQQSLEKAGNPIVPGSPVIIDTTEYDGIYHTYITDSGQNLNHFKFEALTHLLPKIDPNEHRALIDELELLDLVYDEMEGSFLFRIALEVGLTNSQEPPVQPRLIYRDGESALFMKLSYKADRWLFAERALVRADGSGHSLEELDFERDQGGGTVSEWAQKRATATDIELLRQIATSSESVVRFYGRERHSDRTVTRRQRQQLNSILNLFELLG